MDLATVEAPSTVGRAVATAAVPRCMKLLVFAHTPPPHHGQSYMVKLFLEGFGGDCRRWAAGKTSPYGIECYHVNARLSKEMEDIGDLRAGKLLLLCGYCLQAIYIRFRYGVENFYYVPAPGKRSALYRDWMVMALCRPFFKRFILHWHAAGLAKWLETERQMNSRVLTYRLMREVDLSVVLSRFNLGDAEKLMARKVRVIGNGIPDPCPDFEQSLLPRQRARAAARRKLLAGERLSPEERERAGGDPECFRALFLAHCTREKGVFDALDGVALANARLAAAGSPLRIHLTVAGAFLDPQEQTEFERRIAREDLQPLSAPGPSGETRPQSCVSYAGFVAGAEKNRAFAQSDVFCFPTYYYAENFPLVILEAMAYGLPVIVSRWRSIPELMPQDLAGLVPPQSPSDVAHALVEMATQPAPEHLRSYFVENFSLEKHLATLSKAIRDLESPPVPTRTEVRSPA